MYSYNRYNFRFYFLEHLILLQWQKIFKYITNNLYLINIDKNKSVFFQSGDLLLSSINISKHPNEPKISNLANKPSLIIIKRAII